MSAKWEFVPGHYGRGKDIDEKARKEVRRAAMRVFRHRERLGRMQDFQKEAAEVSPRSVSPPGEARKSGEPIINVESADGCTSVGWKLEEGKAVQNRLLLGQSTPTASESSSTSGDDDHSGHSSMPYGNPTPLTPPEDIDSFAASALGNNQTWLFLYQHFVSTIAPALQPLGVNAYQNPLNTVWSTQALSEPVLLHAILFYAAVQLDEQKNQPWSPSTLYHQAEASHLISKNLNDPLQAASDVNIASIALISAAENINGRSSDSQMHKDALRRLVESRGGLEHLGCDGTLEMLVSIGDLLSATVTASIPIFAQPTLDHNLATNSFFDVEIFSLLNTITDLNTTLYQICSSTSGVSTPDILMFNRHRSSIEYRLLTIQLPPPANQDVELQNCIRNACRLAGLICINYLFRSLSPELSIVGTLKRSLAESLVGINDGAMLRVSQSDVEMCLWVMFVGGLVTEDKRCYALWIALAKMKLGLATREAVENVLRRFVWVDRMRLASDEIWVEVDKVPAFTAAMSVGV